MELSDKMKRPRKDKVSRRDFIKKSVGTTVGLYLAGRSGHSLAFRSRKKSTVSEVFHPGVISENREIDQSIVREMIRQGIHSLTASNDPWSKFIRPEDRVGLKINTLGRPFLYTHHELIQAIVEELIDFGLKENNIIVWDRFERHMLGADFNLNSSERGVRFYGTEIESNGQKRLDPDVVFQSDLDNPERRDPDSGIDSPFSSIFTRDCDKIINIPILKDHGLAGVTLCLKNLAYGVCENNARFHGPEHIGPFISELCTHPLLKKKVVLHIVDGLEGCYNRGPVPRTKTDLFTPKTLWFGTDPVALDTLGRSTIEAERSRRRLPSLEQVGGPVDHIELAAEKGLGTCELHKIELKKIQLGNRRS